MDFFELIFIIHICNNPTRQHMHFRISTKIKEERRDEKRIGKLYCRKKLDSKLRLVKYFSQYHASPLNKNITT